MKKILLGIVIGMVLMIPFQAFASGLFLPKKYGTYSIQINGKDSGKVAYFFQDKLYISLDDVWKLFGFHSLQNDTDKEVNFINQ